MFILVLLLIQIRPDMPISSFISETEPLVAPLAGFFENVFVMAEDDRVRVNRLNLLARIALLPKGILDLRELPGF